MVAVPARRFMRKDSVLSLSSVSMHIAQTRDNQHSQTAHTERRRSHTFCRTSRTSCSSGAFMSAAPVLRMIGIMAQSFSTPLAIQPAPISLLTASPPPRAVPLLPPSCFLACGWLSAPSRPFHPAGLVVWRKLYKTIHLYCLIATAYY